MKHKKYSMILTIVTILLMNLNLVQGASSGISGYYNVAGKNPQGGKYYGLVKISNDKNNYYFSWWIGKENYKGKGSKEGEKLVINWGSEHPVIYKISNNKLMGTWANGNAEENLSKAKDLEGIYMAYGTNPNGTQYQGYVAISKHQGKYLFYWYIGKTMYSGVGILKEKTLTVNWGAKEPVIYKIINKELLDGTWDGGKAKEKLIRIEAKKDYKKKLGI